MPRGIVAGRTELHGRSINSEVSRREGAAGAGFEVALEAGETARSRYVPTVVRNGRK